MADNTPEHDDSPAAEERAPERASGSNGQCGPDEAGQPLSRTVFVLNELGLHARPAAKLALTAQKYACAVRLRTNGADVDGKSILDILTLAAVKGARLELTASGEDAPQALEALATMFKNRFQP